MKKIFDLIKEYNDLKNTQLRINAELQEQKSQLVIDLLREKLKEVNNKILDFENMELYSKEEYNSNIKYIERDNYPTYPPRSSYSNNYPTYPNGDGYDWNNRNEW
jgi:hypothetical protein